MVLEIRKKNRKFSIYHLQILLFNEYYEYCVLHFHGKLQYLNGLLLPTNVVCLTCQHCADRLNWGKNWFPGPQPSALLMKEEGCQFSQCRIFPKIKISVTVLVTSPTSQPHHTTVVLIHSIYLMYSVYMSNVH